MAGRMGEITVLFIKNCWIERDGFTNALVKVVSKDYISIQKDNGEGRVVLSWDQWIDISAFIEKELEKLEGKDATFNTN